MIQTKLKIILFALIYLCGCATGQSRPHPEGVPTANLNQFIQINAPQAWNTFKFGDIIDLQIVNVSNKR